jgi:hypothetical protein
MKSGKVINHKALSSAMVAKGSKEEKTKLPATNMSEPASISKGAF